MVLGLTRDNVKALTEPDISSILVQICVATSLEDEKFEMSIKQLSEGIVVKIDQTNETGSL